MEASQEDQRTSLLGGASDSAGSRFLCGVLIWSWHTRVQKNNKLIWDETAQIMLDLFDHVWHNEREVVVDNITDIMRPV